MLAFFFQIFPVSLQHLNCPSVAKKHQKMQIQNGQQNNCENEKLPTEWTHHTFTESCAERRCENDFLVHPAPDLWAFWVELVVLVNAVLVDQVGRNFESVVTPKVPIHKGG